MVRLTTGVSYEENDVNADRVAVLAPRNSGAEWLWYATGRGWVYQASAEPGVVRLGLAQLLHDRSFLLSNLPARSLEAPL